MGVCIVECETVCVIAKSLRRAVTRIAHEHLSTCEESFKCAAVGFVLQVGDSLCHNFAVLDSERELFGTCFCSSTDRLHGNRDEATSYCELVLEVRNVEVVEDDTAVGNRDVHGIAGSVTCAELVFDLTLTLAENIHAERIFHSHFSHESLVYNRHKLLLESPRDC